MRSGIRASSCNTRCRVVFQVTASFYTLRTRYPTYVVDPDRFLRATNQAPHSPRSSQPYIARTHQKSRNKKPRQAFTCGVSFFLCSFLHATRTQRRQDPNRGRGSIAHLVSAFSVIVWTLKLIVIPLCYAVFLSFPINIHTVRHHQDAMQQKSSSFFLCSQLIKQRLCEGLYLADYHSVRSLQHAPAFCIVTQAINIL